MGDWWRETARYYSRLDWLVLLTIWVTGAILVSTLVWALASLVLSV